MMNDAELFSGIAVVVDDEVLDSNSSIGQICAAITSSGSHVIPLAIPPTSEQIKTLSGVSFFIVDWNLDENTRELGLEGVAVPATVTRESIRKTVNLLKDLKEQRVAPIFVFTNGDVEAVKQLIERDVPEGGHLLVKSKSDVIREGVNEVLTGWVKTSAAAYVLRHWELEYERSKQSFFRDFYTKTVEWPVILWTSFDKDGLPASDELGRLISRNIQSRMTPFDFDLTPFVKANQAAIADKEVVLSVLEGERYILSAALHGNSISPGDVFKEKGSYFLNIRPECDCVARGDEQSDAIELYLLRGSKLSKTQHQTAENPKYGKMDEKDTEGIVYPIDGSKSVAFQFNGIEIRTWGSIKTKRIGRILPPYLTRFQERFAAYLQRPGLSRYPGVVFTQISGNKNEPQVSAGLTDERRKSSPDQKKPPQVAEKL